MSDGVAKAKATTTNCCVTPWRVPPPLHYEDGREPTGCRHHRHPPPPEGATWNDLGEITTSGRRRHLCRPRDLEQQAYIGSEPCCSFLGSSSSHRNALPPPSLAVARLSRQWLPKAARRADERGDRWGVVLGIAHLWMRSERLEATALGYVWGRHRDRKCGRRKLVMKNICMHTSNF